ncbi:Predicted branched-chain amino acid permease [Nocardia cyriacigeorgica GUH-2]|uniref:Predicted branched-chain amino acid permease n=1 Tax=Nocardia cyriacigeorgica (strain GUH-2) TaxID=1127134 RepID=H6RAG5_NOCCG|nr:Predicted branched-chain amino acid permease [Nocardia cyriacigeorgica GUH-2]
MRDHEWVQQLDPAPALAVPSKSRQEQVAAGIGDSASAGLGIFPLGIALGLLVVQAGLPWWLTPALSLAAFAGSLELLLVGMIAATAPLVAVAITVFVVNFRHVFYAFSFPLHLVRNRFARVYSVYAMIDEAYAVSAALAPAERSGPRLLTMQIASQVYWVGGGLVGVAIGSLIPGPITGLEFALVALFTVLALDACRTRRELPSVLLAAGAVAGALLFVPDIALFGALLAFVVLLLARYRLARRHTPQEFAHA